MNVIIYYSNTNQSRKVAEYFAAKLEFPSVSVYDLKEFNFQNAVFVFPVYCQNIPEIAKEVLNKLNVDNLTVVATYGRMCHGNVLHEIQNKYHHNIVAAAYVPTKHSYLQSNEFDDFERLDVLFKKINNPSAVEIAKSFKNPLSNIFPALRSRLGVKIYKNDKCNTCSTCTNICPYNAISCGKTNRKCIRCLGCVTNCPSGALHFRNRLPLRVYLSRKQKDKLEIYV